MILKLISVTHQRKNYSLRIKIGFSVNKLKLYIFLLMKIIDQRCLLCVIGAYVQNSSIFKIRSTTEGALSCKHMQTEDPMGLKSEKGVSIRASRSNI